MIASTDKILIVEQSSWTVLPFAALHAGFGWTVRVMRSDTGRLNFLPRPWRWIGADFVHSSDLGTDFDYLGFHRDLSRITNHILRHPACRSLSAQLSPLAGTSDDITERLRNTVFKSLRNELIPFARMMAAGRAMTADGNYRILSRSSFGQTLAILTQAIHRRKIAMAWPVVAAGIIGGAWKLAAKITAAFTRRLRPGNRPAAADTRKPDAPPFPIDAEVLIFGHHGIGYGDLYEAGYYFRDNADHPLCRERVLILEYLANPNLPSGHMTVTAHRTLGETWALVREGRRRIRAAGGRPLHYFLALPMLRAINVIRGYERSLRAFPKALVAIVHFDIQCPPELIVAAQNQGISCIALQERSNALCVPTQPLILDHYFVYGAAFRQIAQRNSNVCIRQYHEIGPVRSDWIKPRRSKPGPKSILVLDAFSWTLDSASDLLKANSWENNALFLDRIIRLSETFAEHHFLIRGKDTAWMDMEYFKDIVERIALRDNLKVDQIYEVKGRSYDLVNEADFIVARHTSLGDEAMAKGVATIFYEETVNGASVVSNFSNYEGYPLYAHDFAELCDKVSRIITHGQLAAPAAFDRIRRDLYSSHLTGTAAARFHEKVDRILEEKRADRRATCAAA
ncbi:MAG: hypothetical protein RIA64_12830 [Rhodospirillales bacterium]